MIDRPDPAPTLGERLDAQARALIARAAHSPGWTAAFAVLAAHLTRLAEVADGRFDRIESVPARPGTTVRVIGSRPGGFPAQAGAGAPAGAGAQPGAGARPGAGTQAEAGTRPAATGQPAGRPEPQPRAADDEALPRVPRAQARPIPADVRRRIREVAGPGGDVMRAHDDGQADAIARADAADAVTVGLDVYFRQGRLAPDDKRGAALLAHEASHVSAQMSAPMSTLPGRGPARGRPGGAAAEERTALGLERQVLAGLPAPTAPGRHPLSPAPAASAPAPYHPDTHGPAAAAQPMRAAADRDTGAEVTSAPDLEALRRSLMAELMSRLRTEFERGG